MVAASLKPQARDESDHGDWGTLQIATPAIVGGVLLLLFVAYFIWQRRPHDKRSYDYHQVRSEWVTKIERMFVPRRKRQRVLHSSAPVTLDDSMRTSGLTFDFSRRSRQSRSDSTDSQTPLTSTNYHDPFDYPPNKPPESPPPIPKRPTVRWWWLFGSRPQQIKSEEPGQRWRVDDPDGSSTGHGHSNHGHRYAGALGPLHEDQEDGEDEVIRIGENLTSVASTPMTQHFPEQARFVRGMPTVPEHPSSSGSGSRTPVPPASVPQSNPGTPVSSADRGLPPSYDASQSHVRYPPTEDAFHQTRISPYMVIPPPVRAAGYPSPSPRPFHGRELSSDSFLTTQPPMVAASMY
ncbi:hypothetical protein OG21DRAFT_898628 [Imleria badia]|nr:hypothetical protein OG21DRAFT_898628 [Imleria badia]